MLNLLTVLELPIEHFAASSIVDISQLHKELGTDTVNHEMRLVAPALELVVESTDREML